MMHKKSVIVFVCFLFIATVSLAWGAGPFKEKLRNLKASVYSAGEDTRGIEQLVERIGRLAVEIEELSNTIKYKDQREKINRLEAKTDRFQQWVVDLDYKTEALKDLAAKLHYESRMLATKPSQKHDVKKCDPGKVWIPGQRSPSGKWVPGHCAPSY